MGTRPKAKLSEDIEHNGHDKRQRTPHETVRPATVAAVLSPYVQGPRSSNQRDSDAKLEEAVGLARAIDLDVWMVGDTPADLECAHAAGVLPVYFGSVEIMSERLREFPPRLHARDCHELAALLLPERRLYLSQLGSGY